MFYPHPNDLTLLTTGFNSILFQGVVVSLIDQAHPHHHNET